MKKYVLFLASLALSAFASEIKISNAYVLQTPPNAKNTALFLTITNNTNKDLALIKATSNQSDKVELHTHKHENHKMTMLKVDQIPIKAHASIELKRGGDHIMLFDSKIDSKTKIELVLYFDNGEVVKLKDIPSKSPLE